MTCPSKGNGYHQHLKSFQRKSHTSGFVPEEGGNCTGIVPHCWESCSDHAPIGSGLEIVRGLIFSVGVTGTPQRLLVNMHTAHSVFYQGGRPSLLMLAYRKDCEGNDWTRLEFLLRQKKVTITRGYSKSGVVHLRKITGFARPGHGTGLEKGPIIANYAGSSTDKKQENS